MIVFYHGIEISSIYAEEKKFLVTFKIASFFHEWTPHCSMSGHLFFFYTKCVFGISMMKFWCLSESTCVLHLKYCFFFLISEWNFEMSQTATKKTPKTMQKEANIDYDALLPRKRQRNDQRIYHHRHLKKKFVFSVPNRSKQRWLQTILSNAMTAENQRIWSAITFEVNSFAEIAIPISVKEF